MVTEVKVQDGESVEAALRRFKREVLKAGIILEIKKRRHHENKRDKKKRKKEEARRKNSFSFNKRPQSF